MFQYEVVCLFLMLCWSCSSMQGNVIPDLNCEQYANDLEIIAQLPFSVTFDYKKQGPGVSLAILDADNTTVATLALKQIGAIVPESVFCLKNLQILGIEKMMFANNIVPDSLANLQQLFSLGITHTPISKITDKINTLPRLQTLDIDNCSLTEMPSLSGMYKLTRISLPNNRLTKLEGLTNVTQLHLYKNLFTQIPTVQIPESLFMLNMNYNPLEDMEIIPSFVNITDLRLSQTKIQSIPSAIGALQRLNFLDVSFGQLISVPDTISNIPRLQFLVIYGNQFSNEVVDSIKAEFSANRPQVNLLI